MQEAAAVGSLLLTLALVITRPPLGRFGRLHPVAGAIPGVLVMMLTGVLTPRDVVRSGMLLWRPLLTIASIMATTSIAHRLGIFERITRSIEIRARGPVPHAFTAVFVICAITAALFNNDAGVLLLTPIIVPLIRRLYPLRKDHLTAPFAFAVFMAAGVAPLSTSNPMNLVVAETAHIGFNAYALRMLPVSVVGSLVTYAMLRVVFRRELDDSIPARGAERGSLSDMSRSSRGVLAIVVVMFASYPILSYFDAPVWVAAVAGAVVISLIGLREEHVSRLHVVSAVAWDILAFLFLIFLTALGLENIGVTTRMSEVYNSVSERGADGIGLVGSVSAMGSAVLNNHPMAALNALALRSVGSSHDTTWRTLAALVGGDLGPRFMPMGSLAGLLWLEMLRRLGFEISTWQFVRTGVLVTIPTLLASLGVLWLETFLFP